MELRKYKRKEKILDAINIVLNTIDEESLSYIAEEILTCDICPLGKNKSCFYCHESIQAYLEEEDEK